MRTRANSKIENRTNKNKAKREQKNQDRYVSIEKPHRHPTTSAKTVMKNEMGDRSKWVRQERVWDKSTESKRFTLYSPQSEKTSKQTQPSPPAPASPLPPLSSKLNLHQQEQHPKQEAGEK